MFDHSPQERQVRIATEEPSESFETRVLRELAGISERLAKLEAAAPQIVARRYATFYDPLGMAGFTFTGVKDEDGVPVNFSIDAQGGVVVRRQEIVSKEVAPGVREVYDRSLVQAGYALPGPTREELFAEWHLLSKRWNPRAELPAEVNDIGEVIG